MEIGFPEALLVVGLLISIAAAVSGLMHGTVLSISVLAVSAGIALALTDVITVAAGDEGLVEVVELALILTLFADGLVVERELLRLHWGPPTRALVFAMPLTVVLLALGAKLLFPEFDWAEALLLAAVLSPTDPVITSALVKARGVPEHVRHTLNLESGLNDGLAVPFVLFFLIVAEPGGDPGAEGATLLGEAAAGAAIGAALGFAAGRLVPRLPGEKMSRRYEGLYALGVGLLAYGLCELTIGNGFVGVFCAGAALGLAEHEIPEAFVDFSENLGAIFQVVVFFLFGSLIVSTGFEDSIPALAAFIVFSLLVARPLAVMVAFLRSRWPLDQRLFIAWFGARGVASILFALFVLESQAPERSLAFDVAAFVILASIVAHGLTDTAAARLLERRGPTDG